MLADGGVSVSVATGTSPTVIVALPETAPIAAVISALPAPTAVTVAVRAPVLATLATCGKLDVQLTV